MKKIIVFSVEQKVKRYGFYDADKAPDLAEVAELVEVEDWQYDWLQHAEAEDTDAQEFLKNKMDSDYCKKCETGENLDEWQCSHCETNKKCETKTD